MCTMKAIEMGDIIADRLSMFRNEYKEGMLSATSIKCKAAGALSLAADLGIITRNSANDNYLIFANGIDLLESEVER